ncbi:hypothetical protein BCR34DRAFT_671977 [Clohesyomyces aquaticus]|uniref:Glycosyl transferase family 25 domain-containing protein n=1 Tax=Clohesyomyces aquaticus TaxID=1231657 RepID=A0A1Y1ZZK1_9PLEO|nr:hypothetical protein BCR34DRAFT_671977 [Clohesyomyces aquaticus]
MSPPYFRPRSSLAFAGSLALLVLFLFFASTHLSAARGRLGGPIHSSDYDELLQHVWNRTLGFQKIYVINLPTRTDHRDSMSLAAHFSDLQIEYVNGVTEVIQKALPPGGVEAKLDEGQLGNWRSHMNILRTIVEQNISSALILEDDADWDIRIKSQMQDFARAARLLVQPFPGTTEQFLDPTHSEPTEGQQVQNFEVGKDHTSKPRTSPYGDIDRWDLLCDVKTPLGRAVIPNDETVPEPQHLNMQFGNDELKKEYPAHTRVVSRARENVCTLGYAISLPGARRVLYELGVNKLTGPTDLALRSVCDGSHDRKSRTCLTVQPQLFQHHRPVGAMSTFSDISDHGEDYNHQAFTRNVRWSTRVNLPKLVDGETNYVDLFKDGEERIDFGFG